MTDDFSHGPSQVDRPIGSFAHPNEQHLEMMELQLKMIDGLRDQIAHATGLKRVKQMSARDVLNQPRTVGDILAWAHRAHQLLGYYIASMETYEMKRIAFRQLPSITIADPNQ